MAIFQTFTKDNFHHICDLLAEQDADLQQIIRRFGYPPMWSRPNNFESLIHMILEQQVSLASALAALNKLKEKIEEITPQRFLTLTDEELRACYFSRQKMVYARHLAANLVNNKLSLSELALLGDDEIRTKLKAIKGIGDWTVNIYLMLVMHHTDIFPLGDLAAINALKKVKSLPTDATKEAISMVVSNWKPHRTIATMMLWHCYLESKKR